MNRMSVFLFAGAAFLVSGSLLLGVVYIAISTYLPLLGGWSTPPGKFSTALSGVMARTPFNLSIIFIVIGVILIVIPLLTELMKSIKDGDQIKKRRML